MNYLKAVKEVKRRDIIRNTNIKELKIERLHEHTEKKQLNRGGPLQRMNNTMTTKMVWETNKRMRREPGTPKEIGKKFVYKIIVMRV